MTDKGYWSKVVSKMLHVELAKHGVSQVEMSELLAKIGVDETAPAIRKKLWHGRFSAMFFVQCLRALEVKELKLDDVFFEEKNHE